MLQNLKNDMYIKSRFAVRFCLQVSCEVYIFNKGINISIGTKHLLNDVTYSNKNQNLLHMCIHNLTVVNLDHRHSMQLHI